MHLERVGFDGALRALGVDDDGREVLSYVGGEAVVDPDVACAGLQWAPLREAADVPAVVRGRSLERLRTFVGAYGLSEPDHLRVVDALLPAHDRAYSVVREAVGDGHVEFSRTWAQGGRQRAERTRRWITAHERDMRAALRG